MKKSHKHTHNYFVIYMIKTVMIVGLCNSLNLKENTLHLIITIIMMSDKVRVGMIRIRIRIDCDRQLIRRHLMLQQILLLLLLYRSP